jgi:hypothetical protein
MPVQANSDLKLTVMMFDILENTKISDQAVNLNRQARWFVSNQVNFQFLLKPTGGAG